MHPGNIFLDTNHRQHGFSLDILSFVLDKERNGGGFCATPYPN